VGKLVWLMVIPKTFGGISSSESLDFLQVIFSMSNTESIWQHFGQQKCLSGQLKLSMSWEPFFEAITGQLCMTLIKKMIPKRNFILKKF
jgi:hypothetical protein